MKLQNEQNLIDFLTIYKNFKKIKKKIKIFILFFPMISLFVGFLINSQLHEKYRTTYSINFKINFYGNSEHPNEILYKNNYNEIFLSKCIENKFFFIKELKKNKHQLISIDINNIQMFKFVFDHTEKFEISDVNRIIENLYFECKIDLIDRNIQILNHNLSKIDIANNFSEGVETLSNELKFMILSNSIKKKLISNEIDFWNVEKSKLNFSEEIKNFKIETNKSYPNTAMNLNFFFVIGLLISITIFLLQVNFFKK